MILTLVLTSRQTMNQDLESCCPYKACKEGASESCTKQQYAIGLDVRPYQSGINFFLYDSCYVDDKADTPCRPAAFLAAAAPVIITHAICAAEQQQQYQENSSSQFKLRMPSSGRVKRDFIPLSRYLLDTIASDSQCQSSAPSTKQKHQVSKWAAGPFIFLALALGIQSKQRHLLA